MDRKNQVLMTVLGVFALVIVTVGVSYAFFTYTRTSDVDQNITTGALEFGFTDNGGTPINLANALPVSEDTATAATESTDNVVVYDFAVSYNVTGNTQVDYTISMINNSASFATTAGEGYAAMDLTKVKSSLYSGTVAGTYGTEVWATDTLANNIVKTVEKTLTASETTYYRFKMWLDAEALGFDATDNGTGTLAPGADDNYTSEDGQTATAAWSKKVISVKFKVDAESTDTE